MSIDDTTSTPALRGFSCQSAMCGYTAHTREALILHMRSHFMYEISTTVTRKNISFNYENGRYRCSACDTSTNIRAAFIEHIRHHTCKFPYQCRSCKMKLGSIPEYRQHFNCQHSLEIYSNLEKFLVVNGDRKMVDKIASILGPGANMPKGGQFKIIKRNKLSEFKNGSSTTESEKSRSSSDFKKTCANSVPRLDCASSDKPVIIGTIQSELASVVASCDIARVSFKTAEKSLLTPSAVELVGLERNNADQVTSALGASHEKVAGDNSGITENSSSLYENQKLIVDSTAHIGSMNQNPTGEQLVTDNNTASPSYFNKYGFNKDRFVCFACPTSLSNEEDFRNHIWKHFHNSNTCQHLCEPPLNPQSCTIVEGLIEMCKLSKALRMPPEDVCSLKVTSLKNEADRKGIVNKAVNDCSLRQRDNLYSSIQECIADTIGAVVKPETIDNDKMAATFSIADIVSSTSSTVEDNVSTSFPVKLHSIPTASLLLSAGPHESGIAAVKESKSDTYVLDSKGVDENSSDMCDDGEEMVRLVYSKEPLKIQCTRCSFTCNNTLQLSAHDEICKSTESKSKFDFTCPECKFSTRRRAVFTWHMQHHTSERTLSFFSCSVCGRESSQRAPVEKHVKGGAHRNDPNCKIVVYSETFTYLQNIRRCPVCNDGCAWTFCGDPNRTKWIFIEHMEDGHLLNSLAAYLKQKYSNSVRCPEVIQFPRSFLPDGCLNSESPSTISSLHSSMLDPDLAETSIHDKRTDSLPGNDSNKRIRAKPRKTGAKKAVGFGDGSMSNVQEQKPGVSIAIDKFHCDNCEFSTDSLSAYDEHVCNEEFVPGSSLSRCSLGTVNNPSSSETSEMPNVALGLGSSLSACNSTTDVRYSNDITFSSSHISISSTLSSVSDNTDPTTINGISATIANGTGLTPNAQSSDSTVNISGTSSPTTVESKKCNICAFFCNNALAFKQHMKDHVNYDSLRTGYRCGSCNYSHPKLANAKGHVQKFHSDINNTFVLTLPGLSKIPVRTSVNGSSTVNSSGVDASDKRGQATLEHDRIYRTMCRAPMRKANFTSGNMQSKKRPCRSSGSCSFNVVGQISKDISDNSLKNVEVNEENTGKHLPTEASSNLRAAPGSLLLGSNVQKSSALSFQLWNVPTTEISASDMSSNNKSDSISSVPPEDIKSFEKSHENTEHSDAGNTKSELVSPKSGAQSTKFKSSVSISKTKSIGKKVQGADAVAAVNASKMLKYRCKYCNDFEPTHLIKVVKHHILIVHLESTIYKCPNDGCKHLGTNGSSSAIVKHARAVHGAEVTSAECLAPELDLMQAVENRAGVILIAFFDDSGHPILDSASLKDYMKVSNYGSNYCDSKPVNDSERGSNSPETGERESLGKHPLSQREERLEPVAEVMIGRTLTIDDAVANAHSPEDASVKSRFHSDLKLKKNEKWQSTGDKDDRKSALCGSSDGDSVRLGFSDNTLRKAYSRFQGLKPSISAVRNTGSRSSASSDDRSVDSSVMPSPPTRSQNKETETNSAGTSIDDRVPFESRKKLTLPQQNCSKSPLSANETHNSETAISERLVERHRFSSGFSAESSSLVDIMNLPETDCREKLNQLPPELLTELLTKTVKTLQLSGLGEHLKTVIDNFSKQAGESQTVQQIKTLLESDLDHKMDEKTSSSSSNVGVDTAEALADKDKHLGARSKQATLAGPSGQNYSKKSGKRPLRDGSQDEYSDSDRGSSISSRSNTSSTKRAKINEGNRSRKLDTSRPNVETKSKTTAMKSTGSKSKMQKSIQSIKREYVQPVRVPSPCSSTFSDCSDRSYHTSIRLYCHLCSYSTTIAELFAVHMKREFNKDNLSDTGTGSEYSADGKKRKIDNSEQENWAPMRHLCGFCSYSTYLQEEFDEHLRIHTVAKPFRCGYCSYTGFNSYSVKRHQRSVHKNKPDWIVKVLEDRPMTDRENNVTRNVRPSAGNGRKYHNGIDLQPRVVVRDVAKLSQRNIKMLLFRYDLDKISLNC